MNRREGVYAQNPDNTENEFPGTPRPLSPGRTDVNPDREPGIDELPNNDGELPEESDVGLDPDLGDLDPDKAEMDDQPNPR
jgi:hypothetical protein